jgi:hypothetical protein
MSGKCTHVSDPTHYINKTILCSENIHVDPTSEESLISLDDEIKISVDPFLYNPSAKIYFQMDFQVFSNILVFLFLSCYIYFTNEGIFSHAWNFHETYINRLYSNMSYSIRGYMNSSSSISRFQVFASVVLLVSNYSSVQNFTELVSVDFLYVCVLKAKETIQIVTDHW